MTTEQPDDTSHLPPTIVFGREKDGTPYLLYQDAHLPRLYVAKEPLKLPPVPAWLRSAIEEERPTQSFWQTIKTMLGLDTA